jgi:hypothetical protein
VPRTGFVGQQVAVRSIFAEAGRMSRLRGSLPRTECESKGKCVAACKSRRNQKHFSHLSTVYRLSSKRLLRHLRLVTVYAAAAAAHRLEMLGSPRDEENVAVVCNRTVRACCK